MFDSLMIAIVCPVPSYVVPVYFEFSVALGRSYCTPKSPGVIAKLTPPMVG